MTINPQNNAITQRLEKLRQQWEIFTHNPETDIYCWEINGDELLMVEAFVKVENSEHGVFPDWFIRLESPFERSETYTQVLIQEFQTFLTNEANTLQEEGLHFNFSFPSATTSPDTLWKSFAAFAEGIPDFEGSIIVYIAPSRIKNIRQWTEWLDLITETKLPRQVRLLITHTGELTELAAGYPQKVQNIAADLDMPAAMRELASAGDEQDPGVKFRVLFVELSQAASRKDLTQVQNIGQKALRLAQQQTGWEHMEIAVLLAIASALLSAKKHQETLQYNDQAIQVAQRAYAGKHPAAIGLLIQTYFFKGASLLATKDYEMAALTYEVVIPYAQEDKTNTFHHMEAWRMAGFAHAKNGNSKRAWECNWTALEVADIVDETVRQNSTLPYIGQALLQLSGILGYFEKEPIVRQKLVNYVGTNWEEKLNKNTVKL